MRIRLKRHHDSSSPTGQGRPAMSISSVATDDPGQAMQAQRQHSDFANASPRLEQQRTIASAIQRRSDDDTAAPNRTGLPDQLKAGIETLSGIGMDGVQVHYNSPRPAQLNAHAYAQGTHIHVAPGQERHLPHEAWHVVQQAQGRVAVTAQAKGGVALNDDGALEREADVMGARAAETVAVVQTQLTPAAAGLAVQRVPFKYREIDLDTDSPDAIWALFEKYYEAYDEESFTELHAAVSTQDGDLANELQEAWDAEAEEGGAGDDSGHAHDDSDDYYDDQYDDYEAQFEPTSKQNRAADRAEVGKSKRAGSKTQRDKWYGGFANNADAQEWWHRVGKPANGNEDMLDAKAAKGYYAQYTLYLNGKK